MGTSELWDHSIAESSLSRQVCVVNKEARVFSLGFFRGAQNCQFPLTPTSPCGNFLNTQADLGGSYC